MLLWTLGATVSAFGRGVGTTHPACVQLWPADASRVTSNNSLSGDTQSTTTAFRGATAELDIWIAASLENSQRRSAALRTFGFAQADAALFQPERQVIRMGAPPLRLKIPTTISEAEFADCYARRVEAALDGVSVNLIQDDLKRNKQATGRLKDRVDLQRLP